MENLAICKERQNNDSGCRELIDHHDYPSEERILSTPIAVFREFLSVIRTPAVRVWWIVGIGFSIAPSQQPIPCPFPAYRSGRGLLRRAWGHRSHLS